MFQRSLQCAAVAFLAATVSNTNVSYAYKDNLTDQQRIARNRAAIQTIYRDGVPHTDKQGRTLMAYDAEKSFLSIGIWGMTPSIEAWNHNYDWGLLTEANFNTVWPYYNVAFDDAVRDAKDNNLQIVWMYPTMTEDNLREVSQSTQFLGNVWIDEPIGKLGSATQAEQEAMEKLFNEFIEYRTYAKSIAPDLNVFINDAPWITAPATEWWKKWNTAGDVSCHDNYPVRFGAQVTRSISEPPQGIMQTMDLAVKINDEKKPVWFIVGAFGGVGGVEEAYPFRLPTVMQLRSQVYTAIIHGATGIHYFVYDSYINRAGMMIGISPDPQPWIGPENNPKTLVAPQYLLAQSRALWETSAQINKELTELQPVIFAPTVGPEVGYRVHIEGTAITKEPIKCLLKPHPDGGYVLLTVNMDDAVLETTYTFPAALENVNVLYRHESETANTLGFEAGAQTFTLHYEPYDVHVIRILPAE